MNKFLSASHEVTDDYINVKYRNACPVVLNGRCADLLASAEKEEWAIREEYAGNRMLASQLDLHCTARDRILQVFQNTRNMIGSAI